MVYLIIPLIKCDTVQSNWLKMLFKKTAVSTCSTQQWRTLILNLDSHQAQCRGIIAFILARPTMHCAQCPQSAYCTYTGLLENSSYYITPTYPLNQLIQVLIYSENKSHIPRFLPHNRKT